MKFFNRTNLILLSGLFIVGSYLFFTKTTIGKNMAHKISENGLNLLKRFEGFSSKAYWDVKGWSIGFGHFMGQNKLENNISLERGLTLLMNDLLWVENAINKYVKVPLTQNQHDALVSFIYNVGETNFKTSTLLKRLNEGNYKEAANQFLVWNKCSKKAI